MHFETKKYIKKYKIGVFYNKKKHDNLLSVEKKIKKNWGCPKMRPKLGQNLSKLAKIGKKLVLCAFL